MYTVPAGAKVRLGGNFAHARFQSLGSYPDDLAAKQVGVAVDALPDVDIEPQTGSTNPFQVGAHRDAVNRKFTVTMADGAVITGTGACVALHAYPLPPANGAGLLAADTHRQMVRLGDTNTHPAHCPPTSRRFFKARPQRGGAAPQGANYPTNWRWRTGDGELAMANR